MTKQQALFLLQHASSCRTYNPILVRPLGSINAAILFNQCFYWSQRAPGGGEWFWKTNADFQAELQMTPHEFITARKKLKSLGVLMQQSRRGQDGRDYCWYSIDMNAVAAVLDGIQDQKPYLSVQELQPAEPFEESYITPTDSVGVPCEIPGGTHTDSVGVPYGIRKQTKNITNITSNIQYLASEKNFSDAGAKSSPKQKIPKQKKSPDNKEPGGWPSDLAGARIPMIEAWQFWVTKHTKQPVQIDGKEIAALVRIARYFKKMQKEDSKSDPSDFVYQCFHKLLFGSKTEPSRIDEFFLNTESRFIVTKFSLATISSRINEVMHFATQVAEGKFVRNCDYNGNRINSVQMGKSKNQQATEKLQDSTRLVFEKLEQSALEKIKTLTQTQHESQEQFQSETRIDKEPTEWETAPVGSSSARYAPF